MSKLYLHKLETGKVKTTKNTIVADISKIKKIFHPKNYTYIENKFNKIPKEFILTGGTKYSSMYSNLNFIYFPVEKVVIDSDFRAHRIGMKMFKNAKELEIGNNVKYIEITNNFGLNKLEKIIIPFSIENFSNKFIQSDKIKTLIIKHENYELILEMDDVFEERVIALNIHKVDNKLKIYVSSKYSVIKYDIYINDEKLEFTKNYNRYEIKPNEDKVLDLIKLKQEYNCKLIPNLKLKKEKVILTKEDYKFLDFIDKNILKELIIKDDNEMSLFPKTININSNNGLFKNIEILNDKLLIHIENVDKNDRYILINDDLSYVDFEKNNIDKVYLDFDSNNYKLNEVEGKYNVTLPFSKDFNLENSKILSNLVNSIGTKYIKNKEHEILIKKLFPTKEEIINLINIEKNNKRDFKVVRKVFSFNAEKIYNFDENNNEYIITYVSKNENNIEEYNAKKLILKK